MAFVGTGTAFTARIAAAFPFFLITDHERYSSNDSCGDQYYQDDINGIH